MDGFLLNSDYAEQLYYNTASGLPVIDYHNHLSVLDISSDRQFDNIYELWLKSDPYKHRAMRICGVDERYITGSASAYEKFEMWSKTLPKLVGNPLYHWAEMELKNVFDVDVPLNENNAREIWEKANVKLKDKGFSAKSLLKKFNVEYSAPCTSVVDDISVFDSIKDITVPSLRGDDITAPTKDFINKLENLTNIIIKDITSYFDAVYIRFTLFDKIGCNFADHAIDYGFTYNYDEISAKKAFDAIISGEKADAYDMNSLTSVILMKLGAFYSKFNWNVQLHIGALRQTSERLRSVAGPAGGYAAIGSNCDINSIIRLLNDIEKKCGEIPKIILFTLNPADNAVMSIISGSFSKSGTPAVVCQGPAWWWCDHIHGIKEVLENVSAYSVLSTFVGMTTDSRSILSFVRHDYFRRILCGWVGDKIRCGEFPSDIENISNIIKNICYDNAKNLIRKDGK